jgi:hypothetical protein
VLPLDTNKKKKNWTCGFKLDTNTYVCLYHANSQIVGDLTLTDGAGVTTTTTTVYAGPTEKITPNMRKPPTAAREKTITVQVRSVSTDTTNPTTTTTTTTTTSTTTTTTTTKAKGPTKKKCHLKECKQTGGSVVKCEICKQQVHNDNNQSCSDAFGNGRACRRCMNTNACSVCGVTNYQDITPSCKFCQNRICSSLRQPGCCIQHPHHGHGNYILGFVLFATLFHAQTYHTLHPHTLLTPHKHKLHLHAH